MTELRLDFEDLHQDGPVTEWHEKLLRVTSTVSVKANGRVLLSLGEIPVIELARSLLRWRQSVCLADFSYDSVESNEPGIIRFVQYGACWSLQSAWIDVELWPELSSREVHQAVDSFVSRVRKAVCTQFGPDFEQMFR